MLLITSTAETGDRIELAVAAGRIRLALRLSVREKKKEDKEKDKVSQERLFNGLETIHTLIKVVNKSSNVKNVNKSTMFFTTAMSTSLSHWF